MRSLAALIILILAGCNSASSNVSAPTTKHRLLITGQQAQRSTAARQAILATTAADYERLWSSIVGEAQTRPAVDFDRESVLFLISAQMPTGGYSVEVGSVRREGETLVVDAPIAIPPPDAMTIQVLTRPFAVVAIEKQDVSEVRWIE